MSRDSFFSCAFELTPDPERPWRLCFGDCADGDYSVYIIDYARRAEELSYDRAAINQADARYNRCTRKAFARAAGARK